MDRTAWRRGRIIRATLPSGPANPSALPLQQSEGGGEGGPTFTYVSFDGTQRLVGPTSSILTGSGDVTIFAVIKADLPQAADAALFAFGDGAAGRFCAPGRRARIP